MLVLGAIAPERREELELIAGVAGFEVAIVDTAPDAIASLARTAPGAVLVNATNRGAARLCRRVRSDRRLRAVPIIVVAERVEDETFNLAFGWGADDVVSFDASSALLLRLRAIPKSPPPAPPAIGQALVAHPDRARCLVLGRALSAAGYNVSYAEDGKMLRSKARAADTDLVVASSDLDDPADVIRIAREAGNTAVWIVLAPSSELESLGSRVEPLGDATVTWSGGPPENVVFLAHELARNPGSSGRRDPRMLYGTIVAYRTAASDEFDYGFSYNVSSTGLYVRTLAPPNSGNVWLELRPPGMNNAVRLEAKVAWSRGFAKPDTMGVPPGFGAEIQNSLGSALSDWTACYDSFLETPPKSLPPPSTDAPASIPPLGLPESTEEVEIIPGVEVGEPILPPPAAVPVPLSTAEDWEVDTKAEVPSTKRQVPPATPVEPVRAVRAKPTQRVPTATALMLIAGAALIGGSISFLVARGLRSPDPTTAASIGSERTVTATRVRTATSPPAKPSSTAAPAAAPDAANSADAASPSASASADGAPDGAAPADGGAEPEGATKLTDDLDSLPVLAYDDSEGDSLPKNRGLLLVRSRSNATVYLHGRKVGATNKKHEIACGQLFVRLGRDGPTWVSPGLGLFLRCRQLNVVHLEEYPPGKQR